MRATLLTMLLLTAGCVHGELAPLAGPPTASPAVEVAPAEAGPAAPVAAADAVALEADPFGDSVVGWRVQGGGDPTVRVASLHVDVRVDGRLAHTEVVQAVANDGGSQAEGRFAVMLPERAAVTRLAMDIGGVMTEGELHDRERSKEVYEGIVRRSEDPALLEWRGYGRFALRVFPIPARGSRTVVMAWDEVLPEEDGAWVYRYQAPESLTAGTPPPTERVEVRVRAGSEVLASRGRGVGPLPDGDWGMRADAVRVGGAAFEVHLRPLEAPVIARTASVGAARYGLADVTAGGVLGARTAARPVVLAFDTSAGVRASDLAQAISVASAWVEASPGRAITVVSGGVTMRRCAVQAGGGVAGCMAGVAPRGGTDLDGLAREALRAARDLGDGAEVVLFSDGAATMGERDGDLLGGERGADLFAVATGAVPDFGMLRALVERHGGQVVDGRRGAAVEEVVGRLERAVALRREVKVSVDVVSGAVSGLEVLGPSMVAPGARVAFAGELESRRAVVEVVSRWAGGEERRRVVLGEGEAGASVVPLWSKARTRRMEAVHAPRSALPPASGARGVMGRRSSLLVLERGARFGRFAVRRRASAGGGAPGAVRGRRVATPKLRVGRVVVMGSLDSGLIRKVIRAHVPAIRACYQRSLQREPTLGGKVAITFSVEVGQVIASRVGSSSNEDAELHDCILADVRTWRFPTSEGMGRITVTYPFQFVPEEPSTAAASPSSAGDDEVDALVASLPPLEAAENGELRLGRMIEAKLRLDRREEAASLMEGALAALAGEPVALAAQRRMALFVAPQVRAAFPAAFLEASLARLAVPAPPAGLFDGVFLEAVARRDVAVLVALVGTPAALEHPGLSFLLSRAVEGLGEEEGRRVGRRWLERATPAETLAALVGSSGLERRFAEEELRAAAALVNAGPVDAAVVDAATRAAVRLERYEVLGRVLRTACERASAPAEACRRQLARVRSEPGVGPLLERLTEAHRLELERLRRERPGDLEVLEALASAQALVGRRTEAVQTVSELVEFHPWDEAVRRQVFDRLVSAGARVEACEVGADAVALDPERAPWLGDMLALLEEAPDREVPAIEDCVLDAIGRMTRGQAAVAVVMWESPLARLQLGVRLPGGALRTLDKAGPGAHRIGGRAAAPGSEVMVIEPGVRGAVRLWVVNQAYRRESTEGRLVVIEWPGMAGERRTVDRFVVPAEASGWVQVGRVQLR